MEMLLIIDESVHFYPKPDVKYTNRGIVKKGEEFEIVNIDKITDDYWIKAILNSEYWYTNELNKVAIELPVTLSKQKEVKVYAEPNSNSNQIAVIRKKELLYLLHKTYDTQDQSIIWKKVKLENGAFGYIFTDTYLIPVNKEEKKRLLSCMIASTIIVVLLFFFAHYSYVNGHNNGIPYTTLAIAYYVFYALFVFISGFFKSKMEKNYYPNLLNAFANQII